MRSLIKILFSNRLTVVLLFIFALAMAYATFLENDFGTQAVRSVIYNAWWFELIMILLSANFVANIFKYNLLRKEKFPILLFHLAFIITIAGAFMTRYFGYEGNMRIREGEATNKIISLDRYLTIAVNKDGQTWDFHKKLNSSLFKQPGIDEQPFEDLKIETVRFVPDAVQTLVPGDDNDGIIEIVITDGGARKDLFLKPGDQIETADGLITFDKPTDGAINLLKSENGLQIDSYLPLNYMVMATQMAGSVVADSMSEFKLRALYQLPKSGFVVKAYHQGKQIKYIPAQDKEMAENAADLLIANASSGGEEREVIMAALNGVYSLPQEFVLNGYDVSINYGPKLIELPFSIHLRDFQLERYPGSTSPSSYASEVTVIEGEESFPYRIYMNNVLDHRGYRFFQASYDMDELGTVLSVNKDFWGTQVTYFGYFLLFLGMIWTLFGKHSRFLLVAKKLNNLQATKQVTAALAFLLISNITLGQDSTFVIDKNHIIPLEHAARFGSLLVQDMDGRIKPINSLSSEFSRKLYRSTKLKVETVDGSKLNTDQVFLSLNIDPFYWRDVPMIKVDQEKGSAILELLNKPGKKYLSFNDLLDQEANYLLYESVEKANRKKPAERSEIDKEVLKVDERFNVLFQALDGYYLKLFPKRGDLNDTWFDFRIANAGFLSEDSLFVSKIIPLYFSSVIQAQRSGDWTEAETNLEYISTYQRILGEKVIPSDGRLKGELMYNKMNIFNRLFPVYWMVGLFALILAVLKVFYVDSKAIKWMLHIAVGITFTAFLFQTFNLILRWYAADYPPWSNGYEMIILVSWFLLLFGFIFYKKSDFVLPLSALFTGTLLFVSFLDWLNPEITNLVPVLKSYWLKIHVAVIVGSYAPLALSALLGIMVLIFMAFPKEQRLNKSIEELTYINELSMTVGIFMLTIGTFLGGIWANESWGRYWGWDPKETWALISVIVYAIVLHLRLIPNLNNRFTFNVASVFAFYSIMMTSFGVNYYLSGLHSYAAGDPLPIPSFVYWVTGALVGLALFSNYRKGNVARL